MQVRNSFNYSVNVVFGVLTMLNFCSLILSIMYNFEIKKASNIYNLLWYTFSLNVLINCLAFLFLMISLVNSSNDKKSIYKYMLINAVILIALILVTHLHG